MFPVILKQILLPDQPDRTVVTYSLIGNRKNGFGIKIIETYGTRMRVVNVAENISDCRAEALSLMRLFCEEGLLAVHLHEVLEDYQRSERPPHRRSRPFSA